VVEDDWAREPQLLFGDHYAWVVFARTALVFRYSSVVRTVVGGILEAVFVVVALGTTVAVLKAVSIFRFVRACIRCVDDTIAIVVGVGTTVGVLKAVSIFAHVRTAIGGVADAISVSVIAAMRDIRA
jgi:hypothetical protein